MRIMRRLLFVSGLSCLVGLTSGCSSDEDNAAGATGATGGADGGLIFGAGTGNGGRVGSGAVANAGASSGTGGSSGSGTGGAAGSCAFTVNDAGCTGVEYAGEAIPLDIYVMFDQSGSMLTGEQGGVTRMEAVRQAVGQFLHDPKSAGLSVGIGYFGYEAIGKTTCDPADYSNAAVPIGRLPDNAQAIVDSLNALQPTGETPTAAAIRGACTYATGWATSHPGHQVVILLVTDGKPEAPVTCSDGSTTCCPTLDDAVAATTACRDGDRGLYTYVLGVGPLLDNLGQIAIAGGTKKAYLVAGGDVTQQVLDALNQIRAAASIPCELAIPPAPSGKSLDLEKVNLVYTTEACETRVLAYRDSPGGCDLANGGWFFDNPSAPNKVFLCSKSCSDVSFPGSRLLFSVGCARYSIH